MYINTYIDETEKSVMYIKFCVYMQFDNFQPFLSISDDKVQFAG